MEISVIISTYNPDANYFEEALKALRSQTYPLDHWELIIVDNNSTNDVLSKVDLSWHPHSLITQESKQGLTYSRVRGFSIAQGRIIILADDDNVLDPNYLAETALIFEKDASLGAIGGKSIPLFIVKPPTWLQEFYGNLAVRDLGNKILLSEWQNEYPSCSPIGAGMAILKKALTAYINGIQHAKYRITDRRKFNLSSGGDNEIVLQVLKSGWRIGYFPSLLLHHIIPPQRMEVRYLARLLNNTNKSWVQVLENNQINPWDGISKATLFARKTKAFFSHRAWQSKSNYVKWRGACGLFDGLATLTADDQDN